MTDEAQGTEVAQTNGLRFSKSVENIAPAFLQVQKQVEDPPRSGENPHFGSAYVTLEDLIHTVRPVLTANGISLHQAPGMEGGEVTVETLFLHESGEWARCVARSPMQRNDPQGVGSAITYLRRYSLASMLGLVHEADDDANRASGRRESKTNGRSRPDRTTDTDSDLTCPDCGGPVWDNRDDEKAALNGGKRPNFKCKDRDGCNWASWDSEEDVWGVGVPDEIDAALNELSGLNADRSAEARAWVEGLAADLYDDPEKTASVLSTIEQAIAEERANGGAPSESNEAASSQAEQEFWSLMRETFPDAEKFTKMAHQYARLHPARPDDPNEWTEEDYRASWEDISGFEEATDAFKPERGVFQTGQAEMGVGS